MFGLNVYKFDSTNSIIEEFRLHCDQNDGNRFCERHENVTGMEILRKSFFWNETFHFSTYYFGESERKKQKKWLFRHQEEVPRHSVEQIFSPNISPFHPVPHFYLLLFLLLHRYGTEDGLCHFDSCHWRLALTEKWTQKLCATKFSHSACHISR